MPLSTPRANSRNNGAETPLPKLSDKERQQAEVLLAQVTDNPLPLVCDLILARRQCDELASTVLRMESEVAALVDAPPLLVHLEKFVNDEQGPFAVCRMGQQSRKLKVHPDVDLESFAEFSTWDYVCVHPTEMLVIGVYRDADFYYYREHGEIVDFAGYLDRESGLVRVTRDGHREDVVRLAPHLAEQELHVPAKLVLQRGDERFAIARVPSDQVESRHEVPIDSITTRLRDLAGLDEVIGPIQENILLRMVFPELRNKYGLKPLRGMMLSSMQPGMGKTALIRGLARWLHELGQRRNFDVVLYHVLPNSFKTMWHGGDAKNVREFCATLRARQADRTRPLFQLVVLDEIDSLGKRAGGEEMGPTSSAHNDVVNSLLAEMDGLEQVALADPPAETLWIGLTNRPDMVDAAIKRAGRFADFAREMPRIDRAGAEGILAVHACRTAVPWYLDGEIRLWLDEAQIRSRFIRPALERVFSTVVLRYTTDTQRSIDVTAGQILTGASYEHAVGLAVTRAARREMYGQGVPAVGFDDLLHGLLDEAASNAANLAADRSTFIRQQGITVPVARVQAVDVEELSPHFMLGGV